MGKPSPSSLQPERTLSPPQINIACPYPLDDDDDDDGKKDVLPPITSSPGKLRFSFHDGEKVLPPITSSACNLRFSFHDAADEKLAFVERDRQPWISWKEVRIQCSLAGPLILGNLLSFLLQLVSTTFVGHTGSLQLSGASLAYSFSVVTGYSILMGMSGALETLCGQAFGAGEYQKLGVYTQRGMVVLNVVAVPLAVLWVYIEQIFVALGQNAQLASKAGDYGVWLIPTLFAVSFYTPLIKFLQAQSLVIPLFVCFTITLICHVPICYVLVFHSSMGYKGAALANSISLWITVFSLTLYVRFSPKCAASRAPLSLAALRDLKGFLKLAIPSAMMLCTRLSNELGAGNPGAARGAVNVARILGSIESLVLVVFLLLVRNVWGFAYSNDNEVVDAIADYIPLFATSSAFDALQAVLSGVIRGAGWQQAGAYMNLASFYVAGLPTGCLLAFVAHLEGKGLWMGLIVGTFVQFVSYAVITCFMDWKKEAKRAAARAGASSAALQPLLIPSS